MLILKRITNIKMLFFNIKKKSLDNIYNKTAEQSKNYFFNKSKDKNVEFLMEFFQLNFILILWYMNSNRVNKKYIEYLMKKYVKDLEYTIIELGGSETSLRKKVRIMIGNFYGRLYMFSEIFDRINNSKQKSEIKKLLSINFSVLVDFKLLEKYLDHSIYEFSSLDEDDFWNLKFFNKD